MTIVFLRQLLSGPTMLERQLGQRVEIDVQPVEGIAALAAILDTEAHLPSRTTTGEVSLLISQMHRVDGLANVQGIAKNLTSGMQQPSGMLEEGARSSERANHPEAVHQHEDRVELSVRQPKEVFAQRRHSPLGHDGDKLGFDLDCGDVKPALLKTEGMSPDSSSDIEHPATATLDCEMLKRSKRWTGKRRANRHRVREAIIAVDCVSRILVAAPKGAHGS